MGKREYTRKPIVYRKRAEDGVLFHTYTQEGSTHVYVRYLTGSAQRGRSGDYKTHPGPAQIKLHRWPPPSWSDKYYFGWVFKSLGKFPEIDAMVDSLNPNQLKICKMRYEKDMTTKEIADHLNITQRAVRRTLVRAKNTMVVKRVELSIQK